MTTAQQVSEANKRSRWTEDELMELPVDEHDYFERKSGQLLEKNKGSFLDTIAKAISAFANTGGGHLILGVEDDGSFDGLPSIIGKTSIKDWLEQKIPNLVDYPLSNFRVHIVERAIASSIPSGKEVIVIDIEDSLFAPHQSSRDKKYYYRCAGRSEPAPHFYLELLRQRFIHPVLELSLKSLLLEDAYEIDGGIFLETQIVFVVANVGRIAAYKWCPLIKEIDNAPDILETRAEDYRAGTSNYPKKGVFKLRKSSIRLDDTILPGCGMTSNYDFGFLLRPQEVNIEALEEEIDKIINNLVIVCYLATETSPGSSVRLKMCDVVDSSQIAKFIYEKIKPVKQIYMTT